MRRQTHGASCYPFTYLTRCADLTWRHPTSPDERLVQVAMIRSLDVFGLLDCLRTSRYTDAGRYQEVCAFFWRIQ